MAISGRFDADFSGFVAACKQAEISLQGFDANARTVERSLNRIVDDWSGREVISQANLMAEALGRIGGPARLSAAELDRVRMVTEAAADKFRKFGADVPPNLQRVLDATNGVTGGQTRMAKAIADTDNVLDLFGVNLGPARKALDDLEQSAGKTVGQLGLLGTSTLAAGAAFAGWKLGRLIADFGDLDTKIGDATAKLLGWGDVAGEKAAAKADMLAKASKEVGFRVTDVSTAMVINAAKAQETIAANKKLADTFLAEAEAAKKAAADIERVHQSNADKFFKLTQDWVKAMHAREQAEIEAAAASKKAMFDEIDAAMKDAEAQKKLRDAGVDAQQAIAASAIVTTAELIKQANAADAAAKANREMGGSTDVSTEAGARAILSQPQKSIEDFIRLYQGYAPLDYIMKKFEEYSRLIRTAKETLGLNPNVYGADLSKAHYGGASVNVQVSGVWDPRSISEMTNAIAKASGKKVGI